MTQAGQEIATSLLRLIECCVSHCARRFCLDQDTKAELLSRTWMRVCERASAGHIDESFPVGKLLRLTVWTSFGMLREKARHSKGRNIEVDEAKGIVASRLEHKERTDIILKRLNGIVGGSPKALEIVRLWMLGLNGLQTARSLGMDKSVVYRLRKALRQQIGEALDTSQEA